MKNIIFILISCSFFVFCNNKTKVIKSTNDSEVIEKAKPLPRFLTSLTINDTLSMNTDTLLYYQRAPCFGFCPSFVYTVLTNGIVIYKGYNNIEPLGTWYSLISESWWSETMSAANQIDFFNLSDHYPIDIKENIPDLPNTNILIKEYGKRKFISDNHHSPAELKNFEIAIDKKLKDLKLTDFKQ
ncbi:MAG: hypothetical protein IPO85_10140 [Saprospiraceae bacterium]|uniref:DUF6438 domain-containing protein n=1 Tax=Candidatus Defluviibacterium haderslevense TaxID=2981993 RepID=A0A9D7S9G5_9BACT|nr:hypothetical protein [Candidatus Defluviibacterium haderslevense]